MAITPPETRLWWKQPVERGEIVWIAIAFLWGVFMFFMMVWWHFTGQQNLSDETYRVDPATYGALVEDWAESRTVREEGDTGFPVVRPDPGGDAYMYGRLWEWWPILELEKGQTYRLHLSSLDWQHGFSLQPVNMNIQVHPGYEMVVAITPTTTGEFGVVCNEFCGIGHSTMIGRIYVVEPGQGG